MNFYVLVASRVVSFLFLARQVRFSGHPNFHLDSAA